LNVLCVRENICGKSKGKGILVRGLELLWCSVLLSDQIIFLGDRKNYETGGRISIELLLRRTLVCFVILFTIPTVCND
jgi:hypothetical protein